MCNHYQNSWPSFLDDGEDDLFVGLEVDVNKLEEGETVFDDCLMKNIQIVSYDTFIFSCAKLTCSGTCSRVAFILFSVLDCAAYIRGQHLLKASVCSRNYSTFDPKRGQVTTITYMYVI